MPKYTLIVGDVVNGFECYGLFDSEEEAAGWANLDATFPETWQVISINPVGFFDYLKKKNT